MAPVHGNRRTTAPEQLALLGRDHPLADQNIERVIKTLRSRGWNQHPDQREQSQQRMRRIFDENFMDEKPTQGQRRQVSVFEP